MEVLNKMNSLNKEITIIYKENPLENEILLSEMGMLYFRQKFAFYFLMEDYIFYNDILDEKERTKKYISKLQKINDNYSCAIDAIVDQICKDFHFDEYLKSLRDSHNGDCVKVACSCLKCICEEILGIDTMAPLNSKQKSYLFYLYKSQYFSCPQQAILKIKERLALEGQDQELLLSLIDYLESYIKKVLFPDIPLGQVYMTTGTQPIKDII
jgi:hypothetical protein